LRKFFNYEDVGFKDLGDFFIWGRLVGLICWAFLELDIFEDICFINF
jgi:hypothetical protein